MNKCCNFGAEFEGLFCPRCGTKFEKEKVCPNCQAVVDGSVKFCNYCGHSFAEASTATAANKTMSTNKNISFSVWHMLAKVLPVTGRYELILFSLLLWAFFAAPFATMLGESLGNVYTTFNGLIDDFLPVAQTATAFAVICFIYSATVITLSFIPKTAKFNVGKYNFVTLLSFCGNLLYIPFFALGCATAEKCKEIFMENGSFAGITIAFSIVFLFLSVGATVADVLLRKNSVIYKQAYDDNAQAKAEKEERNNKLIAERRAKAAQSLADNGITEPEPVTCDRKLRAKIWLYFKMPELILFAFPISIYFAIASLSNTVILYDAFPIIRQILVFLLDCGIVILWAYCTILLFMPIKLYGQNNSEQMVKKLRSRKIFVGVGVFVSFVLVVFSIIFLLMTGFSDIIFHEYVEPIILLFAFYALIWIIVFISFIIDLVIGTKINRIFNINGKGKYEYTTFVNGEEVPLTIELFCQQHNDYETYRKDIKYYEYNIKKIIHTQQIIEKPKYSNRNKKLKIITIVCTVGIIALYSIVPLVLIISNIFQESKVYQIQNGKTKDEVAAVLGKADIETDYIWSYYSSNYLKLMRREEDLSNKMATAQSFEEAMKIQAELDKVQEKMENTTYKYIIVTFDSDGKVSNVEYNFNYNPSQEQKTLSLVNQNLCRCKT